MYNTKLKEFLDYIQDNLSKEDEHSSSGLSLISEDEFLKIKEQFNLTDCQITYDEVLSLIEIVNEDATTNSASNKTTEEKKQELLKKYKI